MALPWIAIQLGIGVGLWAVNKYILSDDDDPPTKPPPSGLKLPRAGVGTLIPLVYGTYRIDQPVIVWAGNHAVTPETSATPSTYRIDLLLGLGIPASDIHTNWRATDPPQLVAIVVNGKRHEFSPWLAHGDRQAVVLDLGGRGAGGLFNADIEFFDGRPDQVITGATGIDAAMDNANLGIPIDPDLVPGYAHQMLAAVLTSNGAIGTGTGSVGEASNLVSIAFEVRALGPEPILMDGSVYESNPALLLYDLICARVWKLGYDTSKVDKPSFDAAADTLIDEEHGCSALFAREGDATPLIVSLLDQVNGIIVEDRTTKKLKLKLIRDDYPSTIPVLDEDNTVGTPQVTFVTWTDLVNRVDVEFTDRASNFANNHATSVRGANAVGQANRVRPRTVHYPCVHSQALAKKLSARELGISARPLLAGNCRVKRTLHELEPGDPVKAQWPGIAEGIVFRVIDVDDGQPADGAIGLTLIEDVFNETLGAFDPGLPGWVVNPELPEILDPDP